jgi:aryl-alcohol dehydrogenase-like predicted oxidoreductase
LAGIGAAHGVSPARVALAWLVTRPAVTSVIVAARTEAQLAENLAAASLVLSDDEHDRLERATRPPLIYPYWHQSWYAKDRLSEADLSLIGPHLRD